MLTIENNNFMGITRLQTRYDPALCQTKLSLTFLPNSAEKPPSCEVVRRFIIFCFALLLMFRSVGYVWLTYLVQYSIDMKVSELIDSHISEMGGSLIFTVPLEAGSLTSPEYTPVDGEIRFNGTNYRMIKQKTSGKLLYVVCIKDERARTLTTQINEIIAKAAGQPLKTADSLLGKIFGSLMKYCNPSTRAEVQRCQGWRRTIDSVVLNSFYSFTFISTLFHPPSLG